jgi:hypothetical protein
VCKTDAGPITIYVQIYDEMMRARIEEWRAAYVAIDSVRLAGIENVTNTSAARGAKEPARWHDPTLLVHLPADTACANALAGYLQKPPSFHDTRRALELWLPPAEKAAAKY